MKVYNCFTDGSFNIDTKKPSWAFIVVENDIIIHKNKGIIENSEWAAGRQVAGECFAVVNALEWAAKNNAKLIISYDYIGLYAWLSDLWGEKPWKTNKEYTIEYRKKVLELAPFLDKMVKIKAHSGNRWNEAVDNLAKQ